MSATLSPENDYDVIIIGAGPGGTVAGAALARGGRRVAIVERLAFPRFKIGESLLPNGNKVLKEIGVWEKVCAGGFMRKNGAEFINSTGTRHVINRFANGLAGGDGYTWQVERCRFDKLLLDHAVESGCTLYQPVAVTKVADRGDRVVVTLGDGRTLTAAHLVDAGGREHLAGKAFGVGHDKIPYPPRLAVYNHFHGVPESPGDRYGNIIITRSGRNWTWNIPLDKEKTSYGVVAVAADYKASGLSPEAFFRKAVAESPAMREIMKDAVPCDEFRMVADYTYSLNTFGGARWIAAGDAACFIDPIFSSGVYLALTSGLNAARLILRHKPEETFRPREIASYTEKYKRGVYVMRELIEQFYEDAGCAVFLTPHHRWGIAAAVNSIVAGVTDHAWNVRWRYRVFIWLCKLNKKRNFALSGPLEGEDPRPAIVI